jgi:hypothetical protein
MRGEIFFVFQHFEAIHPADSRKFIDLLSTEASESQSHFVSKSLRVVTVNKFTYRIHGDREKQFVSSDIISINHDFYSVLETFPVETTKCLRPVQRYQEQLFWSLETARVIEKVATTIFAIEKVRSTFFQFSDSIRAQSDGP